MRIAASLALLVACSFSSASGQAISYPGPAKRGQGEISLKLEAVNSSVKDWNVTRLNLTVRNTGKSPVVMDRELVVGFDLSLRLRTKESEKTEVAMRKGKAIEKPKRTEVQTRFVSLAPGQSLTRTFDFSKPLRLVHQGRGSRMGTGGAIIHAAIYYESEDQLTVTETARQLEATVTYDGDVGPCHDWFGNTPDEIGLFGGRSVSNTVSITKESMLNTVRNEGKALDQNKTQKEIQEGAESITVGEEPLTIVFGYCFPFGTVLPRCWSMNSAGQCELTIGAGANATRRRIEFSAEQIAALRRVLANEKFLSLKESNGPLIMHGGWSTLTVMAGQHVSKTVRFNNTSHWTEPTLMKPAEWEEAAPALRIWLVITEMVDPKGEEFPERKGIAEAIKKLK